MSQTTNAGIVTAYGAAVRGGYEGTYDQFCADLAQLATVLAQLTNMSAVAETLAAGSSATASYEDGVLTLGIPRGDTGNGIQSISLISTVGLVKTYRITFTDEDHFDFEVKDGNGIASATLNQDYTLTLTFNDGTTWTSTSIRGATGATPNLTIGTVSTGAPGSSAAAEITGTPEDPVLNLTIPKGDPGEVPAAALASTQASTTASKKILEGEYFWLSGILYIATAEIASGGTIVTSGSGANCKTAKVADDVSELKKKIKDVETTAENYALAAFPQETLENQSIASFSDGADDIPIKELTAYIEPVQDLHGYDNPWPAGGGKNLFNGSFGEFYALEIPNGTTITAYANDDSTVRYYDANQQEIDYWRLTNAVTGGYTKTFTLSADAYYFKFTGGVTLTKMYIAVENAFSSYAPYSNICPISGHTECDVTRTGKNLLNLVESEMISDGWNREFPISIKAGTYILSCENTFGAESAKGARVLLINADRETIGALTSSYDFGQTAFSGTAITITAEEALHIARIKFEFRAGSVTFAQIASGNIQLELGSTATTFEEYLGTTYDIDFPSEAGTVYGGKLTVNQDGTGELVVEHAFLSDNGSLNWLRNNDGSFYVANPGSVAAQDADGCACNYAPFALGFDGLNVFFRVNGLISLAKDWGKIYATNNDLKAAFASVPIQFVYKLATPVTYTLTAEQVGVITTLLGENNVWHSCNGDLDITYRADLAKYITKDSIQNYIKFSGMIAGIETGLTASKAYNSGDYFIIGQKLYKATASIASGATFTVGTNCTETTVGAELVTLNS